MQFNLENLDIRKKRLTRSPGGDVTILIFLLATGAFMLMPLVLAVSNAFKPLSELFLFPPQFFVQNPTLKNFQDLLILMAQSWVPMSRYLLNSLLIVTIGTAGNVFFGSLASYILSVRKFPGSNLFLSMVVLSLMFTNEVTQIPNYVTIAAFGWVNTYKAVIIPSWGSSLGLYLMKNFIDSMIDRSLVEAAEIDGANEFRIYWRIVMPNVKPAWLTMVILLFQQLWQTTGGNFLYSEQLKTLPYALQQIVQGGVARQGVAAAVTLIMMTVPFIVFIVNQSKVVDTMGTSGMAN